MSSDEALPPGEETYPSDAWALLAPLLTETRSRRMETVAAGRTRRLRLVIQDVHNPHNVSACLRSAEAMGVQDVDVVTLRERFRPSTVAKGVAPWLTLRRHTTVEGCVKNLRANGYRIAAGLPRPDAKPLAELPLDEPIAVVFGNEHAGVDPAWLDAVDYAFTIPMAGMVESLNISVSAAITLYHLTSALKDKLPAATFALPEHERIQLLCAWACRHTAQYNDILARLRPT